MLQTIPFPSLALETFLKRYTRPRRRARMRPLYEQLLDTAPQNASPAILSSEFSIAEFGDLQGHLHQDAVAAVLAICTLGADYDRWRELLANEDLASAAIAEEIALAAIVAMTRQIHDNVRQVSAARHLKAGAAYRPGIGSLPMAAQETIFRLLPAGEHGISINEQLVMTPQMSTSIVIALRPLSVP